MHPACLLSEVYGAGQTPGQKLAAGVEFRRFAVRVH